MSSSSQLPEYSITLDDTITTSLTSSSSMDTITISGGLGSNYYTIGTGATASSISIGNISGAFINSINGGTTSSTYNRQWPKEWVNCFPEWSRIEDMCKQYPGLDIAFRNFKNTYQLVKDDYDNPNTKK
jgi:hypothetical protein